MEWIGKQLEERTRGRYGSAKAAATATLPVAALIPVNARAPATTTPQPGHTPTCAFFNDRCVVSLSIAIANGVRGMAVVEIIHVRQAKLPVAFNATSAVCPVRSNSMRRMRLPWPRCSTVRSACPVFPAIAGLQAWL